MLCCWKNVKKGGHLEEIESGERKILNINLSLHKLYCDKVIHKANFKFCHLKVLMKYKFIDKFNKNIRIQTSL